MKQLLTAVIVLSLLSGCSGSGEPPQVVGSHPEAEALSKELSPEQKQIMDQKSARSGGNFGRSSR
jgi:starvation-inducible outer membrane lipoprotein